MVKGRGETVTKKPPGQKSLQFSIWLPKIDAPDKPIGKIIIVQIKPYYMKCDISFLIRHIITRF